MNQESEKNFEQLRRMLALKRHEQPPPGYFDRFPGQVLSRIRAGEQGEASKNFTQWLWSLLEAKPAFAGAFGVAICAVLISGILNSEEAGLASSSHETDPLVLASPFDEPEGTVAAHVIHGSGSEMTNGASSLSALFDNYPSIHTQPAAFQLLESESVFAR